LARARRRTKSQKLALEALEIEAEDALGFMARILVQATFPLSRPHKGPNPHEFERVNGRFTLYMSAPPSVGLPYGSYPRLALAWLSTCRSTCAPSRHSKAHRSHSTSTRGSPTA
jgi:hypothetical protein